MTAAFAQDMPGYSGLLLQHHDAIFAATFIVLSVKIDDDTDALMRYFRHHNTSRSPGAALGEDAFICTAPGGQVLLFFATIRSPFRRIWFRFFTYYRDFDRRRRSL
jgi:hypothetical protein